MRGRQVIALHDLRTGNPQALVGTATETLCHGWQLGEKRLDEGKQFVPLGSEFEWTPLKERFPERILELQDLGADRRLLNAIRHLPGCGADPTVAGDVVQ